MSLLDCLKETWVKVVVREEIGNERVEYHGLFVGGDANYIQLRAWERCSNGLNKLMLSLSEINGQAEIFAERNGQEFYDISQAAQSKYIIKALNGVEEARNRQKSIFFGHNDVCRIEPLDYTRNL